LGSRTNGSPPTGTMTIPTARDKGLRIRCDCPAPRPDLLRSGITARINNDTR
jgi:hypothetical protein